MCILTQRNVIHTAKSVASIDQLSAGGFESALRPDGNRRDEAVRDRPPNADSSAAAGVSTMKTLWAEDVAEYKRDVIDIAATTVRPVPQQQPHPPIILGGMGPTGHRSRP
jgi:alkanesulfonate monooxygenase SsuD/methylene tetrahydromethanopterin reductase-like flavin-dependent oxidoreductase (luciferase family)